MHFVEHNCRQSRQVRVQESSEVDRFDVVARKVVVGNQAAD